MPCLVAIREALRKSSVHQLIKATNDFKKDHSGFTQKAKVYVLRNHTLDNLHWFLEGIGYLAGIDIACFQGEYDTVEQEALDPDSELYRHHPDVIILSLVLENVIPSYLQNNFSVEEATGKINSIIQTLTKRSSALIILNTFLLPAYNSQGFTTWKATSSVEQKIIELNAFLRRLSQNNSNVFLVDWNQIEQRLGISQTRDYRLWYVAKLLLKDKFLKEYGDEILKIIKALKGKAKKCLVLDCDNTLWGGIVGEEGIDGIKLDPHDYPGNTFYHFHESVLSLFKRGVLVTLCSKNNEQDVWEVLEKHPYCLLKRDHIAAWRINWKNKAENISAIAGELNIGIDALVFIDENPAECSLIEQMLPEVTVRQVPQDLSTLPSLVLEEGLFDMLAMSEEDSRRTSMMQSETMRKQESQRYQNLDQFLNSLELMVTVGLVSSKEIQRVAQLTQKTNQFNLTTRRYSEGEVRAFVESINSDVLYLHLQDRFGDYGIVGACILKYANNEALIDTFLLSCRAFGRRVEDVFLSYCLDLAQKKSKMRAIGEYLPTAKNAMVSDFYERLGFDFFDDQGVGKRFQLDLESRKFVLRDIYKKIIDLT